jgi:hypothetical protein
VYAHVFDPWLHSDVRLACTLQLVLPVCETPPTHIHVAASRDKACSLLPRPTIWKFGNFSSCHCMAAGTMCAWACGLSLGCIMMRAWPTVCSRLLAVLSHSTDMHADARSQLVACSWLWKGLRL